MKGVVFGGERTLELMSFPDPTPGPGEVVLEIKASGMCGSDLKFYRASKSGGTASLGLGALAGPVIAGHEPCGVVAALGPGVAERQAQLGARVMVHHYRDAASVRIAAAVGRSSAARVPSSMGSPATARMRAS